MRPIGGELVTTITSPSCWGTHFPYLSNPPSGNLLPIIPFHAHLTQCLFWNSVPVYSKILIQVWKRRGHVSRNLDQHNNWQFPYLSSSEVRDKMAQLFPLWWGQELCVAAGWGRAAVQCPTFAKLVIWRAINMTSWPTNSVKLHVKLLILQNTYTVTQHLANVAGYIQFR